MAAGDAKAVPVKNAAYRVTFPILDADGDLVTGAAGLDSEVSIDGGTFGDCSAEATEIATSSGMYYLDLTNTEMNGDTIAIIVKTSTVGAKTTPIVLYTAARSVNDLAYPTTSGRSIDVTATGEVGIDWANIGGPTTTVNLSGTTVKTATDVETDTQDIQGRLPAALTGGGNMKSDALAISGDSTAADNAESFFDGTGYAGTNNVIPLVTVTSTASALTTNNDKTGYAIGVGGIAATAFAANAIDDAALAANAVTEIAAGVLAAATANPIDANIQEINDTTVIGDGAGTPWGP